MRTPAISVLTSCFNAAPFVAETIESVLAQTCADFEYLVIDDGSTDGSLDVIRQYASRDNRIVVVTKPNSGLCDSLNLGLQLANGQWIARLDADDVSVPERLKAQLDFVSRHDGTVLVGSSSIEVDIQGRFMKVQHFPSSHEKLTRNLEHLHRFFAHSTAFFRADLARELGGYRNRLFLSEDWDLWLRLAAAGRIGCLRQPLVSTRLHPSSICHQNRHAQAVMGVAATICHLRRRTGLSDPFNLSDGRWTEFLTWIEKRGQEEGYFSKLATRQALRTILYASRNVSLPGRIARVVCRLPRDPYALGVIAEKFAGSNLAQKLARESASLPWLELHTT
jgi:cellulose synthase/poly-beta-1,6-N-acetylglucosamine synthase-like glycosyltransferase